MDFEEILSKPLKFQACQKRQCINVTIVVDKVVERSLEKFSVTLKRASGLDRRIKLYPVDGEIGITDDDGRLIVILGMCVRM